MLDEPINLLIKDGGKFKLNEVAVEKVFGDRDELAIVISVAGPFRKGKSFLLDYFLRYLKSGLKDLGDEDEPLNGFSWRGGSERDTIGLLAWSKVFQVRVRDGRTAGVILLDTQGAFDSFSTMRESAVVFALSTLLCSVQIYNLTQNIQEDDLQHLQLFTEYGRVASRHTFTYPFQRLVFLVRDWSYPYEAEFGFKGGQKVVDKRLMTSPQQHPELREIRKHISSCFSDVQGFLMPHPGPKVASDPSFDGRLKDLDHSFKKCLENFIEGTLAPEKLLVKKVNDQELKVKDLRHYLKTYMELFSGDALPEPKSILSATAEANHLAAVACAKDSYNSKMAQICGSAKPYVHPNQLENDHRIIKTTVIQDFKNKPKMGNKDYTETFRLSLEQAIDEMYKHYKELNHAKNAYMTFLTPGLFLGCAVFFYVLSGFLGLVGLYSLSNWCNLIVGIYLIGAGTWAYVRWTGELQNVGQWIDYLAHFLWHQIILPTYQAATPEPVNR